MQGANRAAGVMMDTEQDMPPAGEPILRRMVAPPRVSQLAADAPAPRSLSEQGRLALGRALRACGNLPISPATMTEGRMPLCELLERLETGMFIGILENGAAAPGLVILDADIATAAADYQTLSRIPTITPNTRRKPTRTDSALVAPVMDLMLADLDHSADPDSGWGRGYRFASFMEEPRPVGLILDDCDYVVLQTDLATIPPPPGVTGGADTPAEASDERRSGAFLLAVPLAPPPDPFDEPAPPESTPDAHDASAPAADALPRSDIATTMRHAMQRYPVKLNAILARIPMPLGQATQLRPGDVLEVPVCALEQVQVEGVDGLPIATARLGQAHGNRAVRITSDQQTPEDPTFLSAALSQPPEDTAPPGLPADPEPPEDPFDMEPLAMMSEPMDFDSI